MNTLASNLISAFQATYTADAQDLLLAAKYAIATYRDDKDVRLGDGFYAAIDLIKLEAIERLELGDEPDPLLHDVVACIEEFFN